MKVCVADQKKRVVLPGVSPGERFQVREIEPGHFELLRLVPQESSRVCTRSELDKCWSLYALTPRLSWDDLRTLTREP
jgi:hypothetical protein